jgi:hypothetical protein
MAAELKNRTSSEGHGIIIALTPLQRSHLMKKILFISLVLLIGAEFAFGQVYKWIDEKGGVHFTDDPVQVPEKYRPKTERLGLPAERTEPAAQPTETSKKKDEAYKDQLGRGEEYWRGRVEEGRKRLATLHEKLTGLRAKYNELVERFNDSRSTAERAILRKERDQVKSEMDRSKAELDEVRDMLDKKIPEEAEAFKAKSEWVK